MHMLAVLKKIRTSAAVTYKLKYYLNTANLIKVYYTLISSHLQYCITTRKHVMKQL